VETPIRTLFLAPLLAPLGACAARTPAASTPEPPAVAPRVVSRAVPAETSVLRDAPAPDGFTSLALSEAERAELETPPRDGRCPETSSDEGAASPGKLEAPAASAGAADALDATTIRSVVRSHSDGFMGCYQLGLGRDPNLQGRVTTRFDIDPKGMISDLTIAESDLFDCAVIDCIRDHFVTIQFPPPGNVVTVLYPIVFGHADHPGPMSR
jgi:hypothetical protein